MNARKTNRPCIRYRAIMLVFTMFLVTAASSRLRADTGTCGGQMITLPFTDVPNTNVFFCAIAGAYFSGLTNGTDPTHFSPSNIVSREQMAAFITRTLDQSVVRGSRRAALDQYWTPASANDLLSTPIGIGGVSLVKFDGADLWVTEQRDHTVSRVRASDGKLLETWTGAFFAYGVVVAKGRIFATGFTTPGRLYQIDPTQPAGPVSIVSSSLGAEPLAIAFDGSRIWTENRNSISIITLNPLSITTITNGFAEPQGILYDGANIWLTDAGDNSLKKLDSSGNVLQSVAVGASPSFPVFDGTNIWVPNFSSNSISVVRVRDASDNPLATPFVLATLRGNGLSAPTAAGFDGQRILVASPGRPGVSLWKAADLTPLGFVGTGPGSFPQDACSDGINFWITLTGPGLLARF